MKVFITATGANIGKTVFSSLVMTKYAEELGIKYSKPIQTGADESNFTRFK